MPSPASSVEWFARLVRCASVVLVLTANVAADQAPSQPQVPTQPPPTQPPPTQPPPTQPPPTQPPPTQPPPTQPPVPGPPPVPVPPPPIELLPGAQLKAWILTFSGGLALTNGNRDTSTFNLGYEFIFDPKRRNLFRSDGLFLRGKADGLLSAERLGINLRHEYRVTNAGFVFGQTQYLRDRFKEIDYLIAPTTGLGYRVIDVPSTRVSLDAGLGGVWEKNFLRPLKTSGAITLAEKLTHRLSTTATLTQSISALYKTADLNDALYVGGATLATGITPSTQLKVEVVNTYKTRVLFPAVVHNDVALVVAFVYKR